ncbi:alpha/beta hydrolase [Mucilaginibacter gynuensis]|uniref:Alpha/beta hydrolase n=1 Tax=Mucilaginibacter gynuensis TaxID=1302236 RepID=A0ABP8GXY6_9SPHI
MQNQTTYNFIEIAGVKIFYREAGPKDAPTLLLLHGYPSSSFMFKNLINDLCDKYYLIAPDYPGYGKSDQPPIGEFAYTFDNFAAIIEELLQKLSITKYSIYLMDYGAPIGYRLATKHPENIDALIVQNGCAYEEGLDTFWEPIKAYWHNRDNKNAEDILRSFFHPDGLKWQYTHGVPDTSVISPDNWEMDLRHLERPENAQIQLDLIYDYKNNPPKYPEWQQYFRDQNPAMLIVYGKNDYIFPASVAEAYKKDVKNLECHLFDTGHFALESHGIEIAATIKNFLGRKVIR